MNNKKGFTLVELLAVLVILALIALIAVPSISKIVTKQQKNTFAINVRSLLNAAKTDYYNNERDIAYYKYENNKLYYVLQDGSQDVVNVDGKIDNGEGFVYYSMEDDLDTFMAYIHDDDWCAIIDSSSDEEDVTQYEGSCSGEE